MHLRATGLGRKSELTGLRRFERYLFSKCRVTWGRAPSPAQYLLAVSPEIKFIARGAVPALAVWSEVRLSCK